MVAAKPFNDKTRSEDHPRGGEHPNAKLTEAKVIEMYRLAFVEKWSHKRLADHYGVKVFTVNGICAGCAWKHLWDAHGKPIRTQRYLKTVRSAEAAWDFVAQAYPGYLWWLTNRTFRSVTAKCPGYSFKNKKTEPLVSRDDIFSLWLLEAVEKGKVYTPGRASFCTYLKQSWPNIERRTMTMLLGYDTYTPGKADYEMAKKDEVISFFG